MDDDKDDKSLIEKAVDSIKDFATIVTDATKAAMEPEPLKPGEEVVMVPPMASGIGGGVFGVPEMPTFVVIPKKAARKNTKPDMSGRTTPTYDFPAPTSKMPVTSKITKRKPKPKAVAKKKPAKKSKKTAPKKSAKKASKKSAKKAAKKAPKKSKKKAKKSKRS